MKHERRLQCRALRLSLVLSLGLALLLSGVTSVQAGIPPAQIDAARLLAQATFGPTRENIAHAVELGNAGWVDEQLNLDASLHLPLYQQRANAANKFAQRHYVWWERSVKAPDQLRQRVAFALSEIMVVSEKSDIDPVGLTYYYDVLVRNAFGNFRTLLQEMALAPAMGRYLSMLGNQKSDAVAGIRADENFARELMQLFTIGLAQMNNDGSRKIARRSNGASIPTYSQTDVENLARIFTGWHWAGMSSFNERTPNWVQPMQAYEDFHDDGPKRFLNQDFPAGQTAGQELTRVLDLLFQHPNAGPFLARQLIQRLITSNPSSAYIGRVASVFNDNGQGVRGDLKAVVRAILLDTEARIGFKSKPQDFGKLREPVIRITHIWRAFHAAGVGAEQIFPFDYSDDVIGEGPLTSPSVFNFFSPSYSPPGFLSEKGYRAPELQLVDESSVAAGDNFLSSGVVFQYLGNPGSDPNAVRIDLSYEKTLAADIPALLDHLSLVLMSGPLSKEHNKILTKRLKDFVPGSSPTWDSDRVAEAIYLITASPMYLVQK